MNVGSLFAGIGGFDLGFERCGMGITWQVARDPYCRAVLERPFPDALRYEDVRDVGAHNLEAVDLICGGFPCQDLSTAGRGAGLDGARSGLWTEFARIVRELRPSYVVVENVPALLTGKGRRWERAPIGRVLGDLAEVGYDAEWSVLSAREFGAPHLRKRVWIVAYPARDAEAGTETPTRTERQRAGQGGQRSGASCRGTAREQACSRCSDPLAHSEGQPERAGLRPDEPGGQRRRRPGDGGGEGESAHADLGGRAGRKKSQGSRSWWATEPDVGRVADGVPARVDRLSALGNALLPQIAEWIGRRILEYERKAAVAASLRRHGGEAVS